MCGLKQQIVLLLVRGKQSTDSIEYLSAAIEAKYTKYQQRKFVCGKGIFRRVERSRICIIITESLNRWRPAKKIISFKCIFERKHL